MQGVPCPAKALNLAAMYCDEPVQTADIYELESQMDTLRELLRATDINQEQVIEFAMQALSGRSSQAPAQEHKCTAWCYEG